RGADACDICHLNPVRLEVQWSQRNGAEKIKNPASPQPHVPFQGTDTAKRLPASSLFAASCERSPPPHGQVDRVAAFWGKPAQTGPAGDGVWTWLEARGHRSSASRNGKG